MAGVGLRIILKMKLDFISEHIINPYSIRFLIATPLTKKHRKILNKKWGIDGDEANLCGVYKLNNDGWATFLIIFKIDYLQTLTYGMISHEAQHIVDYTLTNIGHVYDPENNEVGCYLIEWVSDTIFKHFIDRDLFDKLSIESKII